MYFTDANDRKPTYAEIMKARKATAQVNGKALSDSGKSDSGDDSRSVEDSKDLEARPEEAEKATKAQTTTKPEKDGEPSKTERKPERKPGAINGPARRSDFDHRFHGRQYRDRNGDFRPSRNRDRPFNGGDRGNWEYRGRGGGFRGRRGGFRGGYFSNNASRPAPSSQTSADR